MILRWNRAVLLWIVCAFLLQGALAAFSGSVFSKDLQLLTLNNHRFYYYSPHLGRQTTTEPIGKKFQAGDINLYRYEGNWVTGGVDLMGLWRIFEAFSGMRGEYSGSVCAEEGDTFEEVARAITDEAYDVSLLVEDAEQPVVGRHYPIESLLVALEAALRERIAANAQAFRMPFGGLAANYDWGAEEAQSFLNPKSNEGIECYGAAIGVYVLGVSDVTGAEIFDRLYTAADFHKPYGRLTQNQGVDVSGDMLPGDWWHIVYFAKNFFYQ